MTIESREKDFFDKKWHEIEMREIRGEIKVPQIDSLEGKRILLCSCGRGREPVIAAKQGAETYAFDISETAVENAREMANANGVKINADVMDFHNLAYQDNYFDIIYGSMILHHIDCSVAGKEIYRTLKPGGVAYFYENSDRNPLLRFLRRLLFGSPGEIQKQKALFIKRAGTTDEYPLTMEETETLSRIFNGNLILYNEKFTFFSLFNRLTFRNRRLADALTSLDNFVGNTFPEIKKYSFTQEVFLRKD